MEQSGATVARNYAKGRPDIGPILETDQRRALIGWNHKCDTVAGLKKGKIWGWCSKDGSKFQVYDTDDNRSPFAGDVVHCGPANFTMIRMFHPYWTDAGIPKDMDGKDKRRCRALYRKLMQPYELARRERNRDGDRPSSDEDDDPDTFFMSKRHTAAERRKKKKRAERRARKMFVRAQEAKSEMPADKARKERERVEREEKGGGEPSKKIADARHGSCVGDKDSSVEIRETRVANGKMQSVEAGPNGQHASDVDGTEGIEDDDGDTAQEGDE